MLHRVSLLSVSCGPGLMSVNEITCTPVVRSRKKICLGENGTSYVMEYTISITVVSLCTVNRFSFVMGIGCVFCKV
jgi:hypothetical protein